jgi:hypothetical protein
MKSQIGRWIFGVGLGLVVGLASLARAADGSVELKLSGGNVLLKVSGDKDDDWRMQTSTNLTTWTTLTNFGVILSGNETNAPWRTAGPQASGAMYYRGVQTAGLYDPSLFRTISITYTQANAALFSNAMHLARQYGTNIYLPKLWMDNGATNYHIGARFKGNTSYTGGPMGGAPVRKSINLTFDFMTDGEDLMNYSTVNLNNAAGDETVMREPLYFNVMSQYTPCPKGAICQLYANGALWSVYSLIQQENGELINEWFPSNDGDRWRAPNNPNSTSSTAFGYLGNTNISAYLTRYELKTDNATTNEAFGRLIHAINVLNNTTTDFRNAVEDVYAVDNWLWFLAVENVFADDDSYWNKGADYGFYYEIESGRIHPVEHDGNESFVAGDQTLSPLAGMSTTRPLLYKFLNLNELKQRYLAHMRTILAENFNPGVMTSNINAFHALSVNAISADPRKGITMSAYTNDLAALKTFITNRYNFLMAHAELTPLPPSINSVSGPAATVYATNIPTITASVTSNAGSGVSSVWLYFRDKSYGRFSVRQMFDDGAHGDGAAGDNVYGAVTTNYPAGNKIHYYVEARANNAAQAARFSPARAENDTYDYTVALTTAANTGVVINEFMASNSGTIADPQGEFDDWIELRNLTGVTINLTGLYLTDEPANPRKWPFPTGTTIAANGYLLVWADEDGLATPGWHANFKLSADGEQIYLIDTDANNNQVLDAITFGIQAADVSYGRTAVDADVWGTMTPTPNAANQ